MEQLPLPIGLPDHMALPVLAFRHFSFRVNDQHQGACAPIKKGISTFQCNSPAFQPGSVNPVGLEFVGGVTAELQTAPSGRAIALDLEAIGPV